MLGSKRGLARIAARGLALLATLCLAGSAAAQVIIVTPEYTIHRGNVRIQALESQDRPGNRGGTVIRNLNASNRVIIEEYGGDPREGDRIFASCSCFGSCTVFVGNGGDRDTPPSCVRVIGEVGFDSEPVVDVIGEGEDAIPRRRRGFGGFFVAGTGGEGDIECCGEIPGELDMRLRESSAGNFCPDSVRFRRGTGDIDLPVVNATASFQRRLLTVEEDPTSGCPAED